MTTRLGMTLEECIQAVLNCSRKTIHVRPRDGDIAELLQTSLDLLGVDCSVAQYSGITHLVVLWCNYGK